MTAAESPTPGRLVLAATPLGDPRDATVRLCSLIETADIIAAEDTRRFRRLCQDLALTPRAQVVSCYEAVEQARAADFVAAAERGELVLFVSDAGMPAISDPGYRLVVAFREAGLSVDVAPGASAVTAAIAVAGLPSDRFAFEGFLPRKPGPRSARLAELANDPRTLVFFEAANRADVTLAAMVEAFGPDRAACLCRELTKTYQEILPGSLADLTARASEGLKGELTIVVAGASATPEVPVVELVDEVLRRAESGVSRKDAVAEIAREHSVSRRELYNAVLARIASP